MEMKPFLKYSEQKFLLRQVFDQERLVNGIETSQPMKS